MSEQIRDAMPARVAVVTGGTGALGGACVRRLREAGVQVSAWSRSGPDSAEALDLDDVGLDVRRVDVCDAAAVAAASRAVLDRFGRIDALITAAGATVPVAPVVETSDEVWVRGLDNLTGTFIALRAVTPWMIQEQYGRIVTVSSVSGVRGHAGMAAYAAAKAGVIGLTQSLAREVATSGITVNCLAPGAFRSQLTTHTGTGAEDPVVRNIPMGRRASPEEIAAFACWLASDECSYSTGMVFDASGGWGI